MKIVIEIPEDIYNEWCNMILPSNKIVAATHVIIKDGIPLPEHHGDLKDVNDIWNNIPDVNVLTNHFTTYDIQHFINDAPTILDADRGEEDEQNH